MIRIPCRFLLPRVTLINSLVLAWLGKSDGGIDGRAVDMWRGIVE